MENTNAKRMHDEEKKAAAANGMFMLILTCLLTVALIAGLVLHFGSSIAKSPSSEDFAVLVVLLLCLLVG
ncbi:MAG: hypothetical protein LBS24_07930, partial [Clostridiales Family XIII bacterium]|nr:hypothetical protein [Clostridiales Family XIII bacterium]